ncbi:MAG: hypothetical protein U0637_03110 [Phycisphaerales bacterium]
MKTLIAICCALVAGSHALAQSNVQPGAMSSWSENCGWMNWHDAGPAPGDQGAVLHLSGGFLSGFVWCENIGWVGLGAGDGPYANTSGDNAGVNVDPGSGVLTGLAWGENVGWINFGGGALAEPPVPARLDIDAMRLRGYAWGENIGWINLDVPADADGRYVAFVSGAVCDSVDFNRDGIYPDIQDIIDFIRVYSGGVCEGQSAGDPPCNADVDFNNDGILPDIDDIFSLIRVFSGGPCL